MLDYCGYYSIPKGSELTEFILVKRHADEGHTPVFELTVPDVQQGDILMIAAKIQCTNNLHKPIWKRAANVGLGSRLVADVPGLPLIALTNWTGSNVDATIHHETRVEAVHWQAPATYSQLTILFYAKSACTNAVTSGAKRWKIEVDKGYGHMTVVHVRPAQGA